jgi:hypothetical protein
VKERGREKLGRAGLMGRKRELGHVVNTGRMRERGRKKAGGCCLGWKKGRGPHGKEMKRRGKGEVCPREVGPRELLQKGRGKSGLGVLFFFSNTFSNFQKFKLFQNFSTFKLFSKIFKSI